jgi:hypothetical protein
MRAASAVSRSVSLRQMASILEVIVGLGLLVLGGVLVAHGLYRLHRPDWEATAWWRRHSVAAAVLSGKMLPTFRGEERNESFTAALEAGAGFFVFMAGLLFVIQAS